jgi:hypothetical protein
LLLNTEIVADDGHVDTRLAQLGLTRVGLLEALNIGRVAAAGTTEHNPATAEGFYFWSDTYRALCDWLVPTGEWRKGKIDGRDLVVNDRLRIAVTPRSGNEHTGNEQSGNDPLNPLKTRNVDGPATRRAVIENQLVFEEVERAVPRMASRSHHGFVTWFLLHYRDEDGAIRSELACPGSLDASGEINGWATRIILGEIGRDPEPYVRVDEPDAPYEPDVAVTPKSA